MTPQPLQEERRKHERYMKMALNFALRGTGNTSPNPLVGCVIVDEARDRIVSWGVHRQYGEPHAEVDALRKAGGDARGQTLYVNLEPCCHTGKTPPCTDALIEAGVGRVVAGTMDPNPLVGGKGLRRLQDAGIDVVAGVLEEECRWINRGFIRRVTLGRPWVTVKAALSLDGNMALETGESKWISGADSRKRAHMMRAENDAILVGVGTILRDDPMLTVRDVDGRSPLKVAVDRNLEMPPSARVLDGGRCIVFTGPAPDETRARELEEKGARILREPSGADEPRVSIGRLLLKLGELGVNTLMVEGGARIIGSFIESACVDEYSFFVAPKLLGNGLRFTDRVSFPFMEKAISMKRTKIRKISDDIWFEGVPVCSPDL